MGYNLAFSRLVNHEGGFQNDRNDRGNWTSGRIGVGQLNGTKFGISAMSYPTEDIANMSLDRAKFLYKRDFWDIFNGQELHPALAFQLFDAAVNHGPGNAIRILQRALDVADDGDFGPMTEKAADEAGIDDLLKVFNARRIQFFTRLSTFSRYGAGWMNRVAENLIYAAEDYTAPWYENVRVA